MILYILGGHGPEFESVVVNLTTRESVTLQEVQSMLQIHEVRIENLHASTMIEISQSAAHLT